MKEYTARSLSNPMDKLPAIAGLRQLAQERMIGNNFDPGQYLAGLWSNDFIDGLLWRAMPGTRVTYGPREFTGPTWSWSSVQCPVEYDFIHTFRKISNRPELFIDSTVEEAFCRDVFQWDSVPNENAYTRLSGQLRQVELATVSKERTEDDSEENLSDVGRTEKGMATLVRTRDHKTYRVFMDLPEVLTIQESHPHYSCWAEGQCDQECSDSQELFTSPYYLLP